jgi:hypothetical protein
LWVVGSLIRTFYRFRKAGCASMRKTATPPVVSNIGHSVQSPTSRAGTRYNLSMTNRPRYAQHQVTNPRWFRVLWLIVALHALRFAMIALKFYIGPAMKIVAVYFLILSVVGLWKNWGPTVLTALAGFYFGSLWFRAYPYTHNAWEVMMEDVGFPVIFAALGVVGGACIEIARASGKRSVRGLNKADPHIPPAPLAP